MAEYEILCCPRCGSGSVAAIQTNGALAVVEGVADRRYRWTGLTVDDLGETPECDDNLVTSRDRQGRAKLACLDCEHRWRDPIARED